MKMFYLFVIFALSFQCILGQEAILLQQVGAITFDARQMTTSRRTYPLPQLKCVGGEASHRAELHPEIAQCVNVGVDSFGEVQWRCEAELDSRVRFGKTEVSCEGYSSSRDPYVLQGSCSLEYSLEYTQLGKQQARGSSYGHSTPQWDYHHTQPTHYYEEGSTIGTIFFFIIVGIIIYGILKSCFGLNNLWQSGGNTYIPQSYAGSYTQSTPYYPSSPSYTPSYGSYNTGGGFWSGLAGGSLMGYLLSRNRTPSVYSHSPYARTTTSSPYWGTPTSTSTSPSHSPSSTRTASAYATTKRR